MAERTTFTEDELDKLGPVTERFRIALATAAAVAMSEFHPDIRLGVMYHLQDATSLFQPGTFDMIANKCK